MTVSDAPLDPGSEPGPEPVIRLLVVDDHRMLRETLGHSMVDEGFDVVAQASDGFEAIDAALAHRPDVVLMDVTMPGLGGIDATRRIVEELPGTQVVMLTMHTDANVVSAAIRAGAVGFLNKDCAIDEVAETVRAAAQTRTDVSPQLAARMLVESGDLVDGEDPIVSRREVEVLQLIADGCSTVEVAESLFISQKTVKNHLASIYGKLDTRDRTQAVLAAVRMGIVRLYD